MSGHGSPAPGASAADPATRGQGAPPFIRGALAGSRGALAVAAATLVCLLPFADKAFHIDDHRYVEMARQIHQDPFDFFGFDVVLGGSAQPEAEVAMNPPLVSFFAAAAALVTGWGEVGLHLAFMIPALAAALGIWALAHRLCRDPVLAAWIALTFPVFLVSATTLMADVAMTSLFCWSLWLWIRGLDRRRGVFLAAGALLAGLCALTKYFGISLIPLLIAYTLVRERRVGLWCLHLSIPVALLVGYELYTLEVYGVSAILKTAGYSVTTRTAGTGALERALVALVFAGGAFLPALFFAVVGFTARQIAATGALAALVLVACLVHGELAGLPFQGPAGFDWNFAAHAALFSAAGVALFVLLAADLFRQRDADSVLLALWMLGAFTFATVVNYTTNGRVLLPMAPPLAILLARRIGTRADASGRVPGWCYLPLAPALALSVSVAWGDAALADAARSAARRIGESHAADPGTLWFEGSWGFQHYMWEEGARAVDVRRNVLRPGDRLASSDNSQQPLQLSPKAASVVDEFEIALPPVTTMLRARGTGFYAIQWGPLPYRFAAAAGEHFQVRRLNRLVIFETDPAEIERRGQELYRSSTSLAVLLALDARGWPPPPLPAGDAAIAARAIWSRCAEGYAPLADAVSARCLWCASAADCTACTASQAAALGIEPICIDLLWAAVREHAAGCRWELDAAPPPGGAAEADETSPPEPVCVEAVGIWRSLVAGAGG